MQAFIKQPRNLPLLFQLHVALQVRTGRLQRQVPQGSVAEQPVPGSPERAALPGAPAAPSAGSGARLGAGAETGTAASAAAGVRLQTGTDTAAGGGHVPPGQPQCPWDPKQIAKQNKKTQPNPKQTKTNPRNFNIIESIISSLVQHSQQAATLQDSLKCTNPEDY